MRAIAIVPGHLDTAGMIGLPGEERLVLGHESLGEVMEASEDSHLALINAAHTISAGALRSAAHPSR